MLSVEECRRILGPDHSASDHQVEELRDRIYRLARLMVEMARDKRQKDYGAATG